MILTQYCHQLGKECDLKAAIAVSAVMECTLSRKNLEEPWMNYIYTRYLANHLCNLIQRYDRWPVHVLRLVY